MSSVVRAYYDRLAARRRPGPLVPTSRHWYALAAAGRGRRVLDVGCGNGLLLERLADAYRVRVGVDISRPRSLGHLTRQGIRFHRLDLESQRLPYPAGYFDLVIALDVIEHVFDPLKFLSGIHRALAPGGRLVLSTPNVRFAAQLLRIALRGRGPSTSTESFGYDGGHLHYFTTADLVALARTAGFGTARAEGMIHVMGKLPWLKRALLPLRGLGVVREFAASGILLVATKHGR